jgi:hypothetical protein
MSGGGGGGGGGAGVSATADASGAKVVADDCPSVSGAVLPTEAPQTVPPQNFRSKIIRPNRHPQSVKDAGADNPEKLIVAAPEQLTEKKLDQVEKKDIMKERVVGSLKDPTLALMKATEDLGLAGQLTNTEVIDYKEEAVLHASASTAGLLTALKKEKKEADKSIFLAVIKAALEGNPHKASYIVVRNEAEKRLGRELMPKEMAQLTDALQVRC